MSTPSRILVIDDDLATCRFMQPLLARPDRQIEAMHDPELTLARTRDEGFDLIDRRTLYRMADRFGFSLE